MLPRISTDSVDLSLGISSRKRTDHMFRYTLSYVRYVLTALSTVAFKLAAN